MWPREAVHAIVPFLTLQIALCFKGDGEIVQYILEKQQVELVSINFMKEILVDHTYGECRCAAHYVINKC